MLDIHEMSLYKLSINYPNRLDKHLMKETRFALNEILMLHFIPEHMTKYWQIFKINTAYPLLMYTVLIMMAAIINSEALWEIYTAPILVYTLTHLETEDSTT